MPIQPPFRVNDDGSVNALFADVGGVNRYLAKVRDGDWTPIICPRCGENHLVVALTPHAITGIPTEAMLLCEDEGCPGDYRTVAR